MSSVSPDYCRHDCGEVLATEHGKGDMVNSYGNGLEQAELEGPAGKAAEEFEAKKAMQMKNESAYDSNTNETG